MITVEKGGALTTIQDQGRFCYEKFGISPAGPMDERSFFLANMLVGNPRNTAALEMTIVGPTLKFNESTVIAITGCNMHPVLNGKPLPLYTAVSVTANDTIRFGIATIGCRAYLAVAGGIDVPMVMNSRATSIQNRVGGLSGQKLKNGDKLQIGKATKNLCELTGKYLSVEQVGTKQPTVVRVILGPQKNEFTELGINTFLSSTYKVSVESNRMAYRLLGNKIEHSGDGNIISDGIATGAIQVPQAGLPIVMLAERQTVGGYAKIATIISIDLPKIGQCRPDDEIKFEEIDINNAQILYREYRKELDSIEYKLAKQKPSGKIQHFTITIKNKTFQVVTKKLE